MKTLVVIAAAAVLAGPALAGGPVVPVVEAPVAVEPTPAVSGDWTGFYIGLSAFQGTYSNDGGASDLGDTDGFGIQAGYLRDFGSFVLGGEVAQVWGNYENSDDDWDATRLKLIGGYDAGRFLPYVFAGVADYNIDGGESDTVSLYGIGARYAVSSRFVAGLEYLVQKKDNFEGVADFDLEDADLSLRLDYRF
ncbi:MAG: outer membrane protein [Alphaproteobacteria bacterium]